MGYIRDKKFIIDVTLASTLSIVCSLVLAGILATIVHYTSINETTINVLNIIFRCTSILVASVVGIRDARGGLIKGLIIGISFIINTYLMFSMISGDFAITAIKVIDAVCSLIFALISGIISVNVKSKQ